MPQLTRDIPKSNRAKLTQDHRIGSFSTPLGKDVLVLVRFDGTEGLSELFEFRIEALSEEADINFDKAIGQQCTLKFKTYGKGGASGGIERELNRKSEQNIRRPELNASAGGSGGGEREFSGIMVEAQWLGVKNDYYSYRIVLRPWLWLLSRTTDCRIWLDKKAPEIIKEVFKDRGFTDVKSELKNEDSYPKLEYCVQYRETDLNFVSRLMEQHGIYYFFKHEGGTHTLVLANEKGSHHPVPNHETIPYIALAGDDRRKEEHIYEWVSERRFRTGKVELKDYNYLTPNNSLISDANGSEGYTRSDMEFFDYPGKYKKTADEGDKYAKWQLEAEQALDHRRHGNGDAMSLFPGGLTKLERHAKDSQNIEYLIVRASHSFVAEVYRSGGGGPGAGQIYYGSYEFLPSDRPFRAPIVTPKPLIHGIQTAKVVTKDDKSTEEIDVEELTEIYVRFYWDRKNKRSCKVRCAQVWSGKTWGGQFIPRVGQEAVIEFLEGDPDRPLVVGTVYNDEYKPPYKLPDKKNIAGIKSDSTKGHGGYNEWNFDDTKHSEKITVHAQKDLDTTILNSETRTIGEEFKIPQGSPSRETTLKNGDDNLTIKMGNQNVSIPLGSQKTEVMLEIADTAKGMITLTVGQSKIIMMPGLISISSGVVMINGTSAILMNSPNVVIGAVLTTPSLMAGAAVIGGVPI